MLSIWVACKLVMYLYMYREKKSKTMTIKHFKQTIIIIFNSMFCVSMEKMFMIPFLVVVCVVSSSASSGKILMNESSPAVPRYT